MSGDLPRGWTWATFGDIASIDSNLVDPADYQELPHIAPNHIESKTGKLFDFTTVAEDGVTSPKHRFYPGHILYSKIRPYLAKVTMARFEGLCSADMYPIRAYIDSAYLLWWMLSDAFTSSAIRHQGRSVLPKINSVALSSLSIPVPPLAEQRRIAAALEDHLSHLDVAIDLSATAISRASRLRAQFLEHLVLGRNARILEAAKHQRTESESDFLKTIRSLKTKPIDPQSGPLVELPSGWLWASLDELSHFVTDGDHNPPKRIAAGIPHITAKGIKGGHLILDGCTYISKSDFERTSKRYCPMAGDVVVTCVGTIGRVAVVPTGIVFSADRNLAAIRVRRDLVRPEYVELVLNSAWWQGYMSQCSGSTAQPHLYLGDLRAMPVPLPPAHIQDLIISLAGDVTGSLGRITSEATRATLRAEHLRRSLFREAFAGRLILQDPSDEPASVLLEQIRAKRVEVSKAKRVRKAKYAAVVNEHKINFGRPIPAPVPNGAQSELELEL